MNKIKDYYYELPAFFKGLIWFMVGAACHAIFW